MSVRVSLAAGLIAGIIFVVGCSQIGQSLSPTAPSSSVSSSVGATSLLRASSVPVLSQLNLVDTFIVNANQQLTLFHPPDPIIPPDPVLPWEQNALDFYLKANAVLDTIPPNPIAPVTDALNGIIAKANITLNLLNGAPPDPIKPQIITQAQHTISVATALENCGTDVCSTP